MSSMISLSDVGPVWTVTLDRPERRNAIPNDDWAVLADAVRRFDNAADARVLVIRGAGEHFSAGADLASADVGGLGAVTASAWMRPVVDAATALHRVTKPTVAAVDGVAVGAGLNLAIGCDVVIATDRARFAELFVRRGLIMDFGGTWLLPRLVGLAKARELALTGRMIDAGEAERIGLVSRVVTVDALDVTVEETTGALMEAAPLAQRFVKTGLDRAWSMTFEQALEFEAQTQAVLLGSEDVTEAIAAFGEKRDPQFRGR